MAVYVCPICNVETTEPKEHSGHAPERKGAVRLYVLAGIAASLLWLFVAGLVFTLCFASSLPGPNDKEGWFFVFVFLAGFGVFRLLSVGIWAIRTKTPGQCSPAFLCLFTAPRT